MPTRKTAEPAAEPITLDQAKVHLRVDGIEEDTLISTLITVAREACEQRIQRTIVESTYVTTLDAFADCMELQSPLLAVESVKYLDVASVEQTLSGSAYVVDQYATPPAVLRASGATWPPVAAGRPDAVRITYTAGYATTEQAMTAVPKPLVQWMLLQLGNMHKNREAAVIGTMTSELPYADALLQPYRLILI
jgi:uncharacterized phiE125 gp8 family phage protein